MISKTLSAAVATLMLASAGAGAANAGCLAGAVVGGVGGHYAGHHALLGAAAGCAVGHHMAVMKHRRERAAMQAQRAIEADSDRPSARSSASGMTSLLGYRHMTSKLFLASALAFVITAPAFAQSPRMDPAASASATTGTMTADQVGVPPMTGTSTTDYVTQAAASDKYEIEAGRIAEHKAKRKDVRQFASSMIKDHEKLTGSLTGALDNAQRKIAKPSDQLSSDKQAMIDQLNNTPRGSAFDNLYLTQQLQAHQQAWALQKGYTVDGDDAALRQVASAAVPTVESHLAMVKQLQAEH